PLRKSQNGTLNLSLLWYGQFTPVQKERAHGLGICNETYALTINGSIKATRSCNVPESAECAWPFHIANKGLHGMTYQPPSGEIGADALVIKLATGLPDVTANPALTESLFKSEPPYNVEGNHSSSVTLQPSGVFGSGAFLGFTGKNRVDPVTGGAFNSHGINHFLIPSVRYMG
ncbi:hypothetical protein HID58_003878, partial [Brassica napus]